MSNIDENSVVGKHTLTNSAREAWRMTDATACLMSSVTNREDVFRQTQEDLRSVAGCDHREIVGRNQGIVDSRTKKLHGRLIAKVRRRELLQKIAKCEELMQDLLETQDPENEWLYDKLVARKAELEAQL